LDLPHEDVEASREVRERHKDRSNVALHAGVLWKLNHEADPMDAAAWNQRDMWVANNGSLCYYSKAENSRLVLLDSHHLYGATVTAQNKSARENTFEITTCHVESSDSGAQIFVFAGVTPEDTILWLKVLKARARMEAIPTMHLGLGVARALDAYKLAVKNRRIKVEAGAERQFEPTFKGSLWKVAATGDGTREQDWFKREVWLARNGSFVYWSPKDNRELVYYTASDVVRAKVVKIPEGQCLKPFAFEVRLPPNDGMQFSPGRFAAESESVRDLWIQEFAKAGGQYGGDDDVDCFAILSCCASSNNN